MCEICDETSKMTHSQLVAVLKDELSGVTSWKLHALAELVRRKIADSAKAVQS